MKILSPFAAIIEKSREGFDDKRIKDEYEDSFVELNTKDLSSITLVTKALTDNPERLKMTRVAKENNDKMGKQDEGLSLYISDVCAVLFAHLHHDNRYYSLTLYYHDLDDSSYGVRFEEDINHPERTWDDEPEEVGSETDNEEGDLNED